MPFRHMIYYGTNSANPYYYGDYPHMAYSSFGYSAMMVLALITWVLVTIILILGIFWLLRQIKNK